MFLPGLSHLSALPAQLLPWQGRPRESPEEVAAGSLCCLSGHHPRAAGMGEGSSSAALCVCKSPDLTQPHLAPEGETKIIICD